MPTCLELQIGGEPYPGYRLVRRIGSGGCGEVWQATTPRGRAVALKFMPCGNSKDTATREIRSLQAIRQLQHPRLIRIERVWSFESWIVIAMEMADGSLADLYETYQKRFQTPIVPEHACLLLGEAAEALDFLNTQHHEISGRRVTVQHCDVKPNNLLLFGESVKVADFGLSSLLGSSLESRCRAGTLEYCAPEVFQGRLSSQTDQFSLAVSYCVVRGGALPYPNGPNAFDPQYIRPAPDLSMLSEAERPIIARALNPVPQGRWPSCGELFSQLTRVVWEQTSQRRDGGDTVYGG